MNIVITGASSGIGYQVALSLAAGHHKVIAVSRNKEKLEQLKAECMQADPGSDLFTIAGDISDPASLHNICNEIKSRCSSIQVLINKAGLLINKPFEELAPADWNLVYSTNVFGAVNMIQTLLSRFSPGSSDIKNRKAHILNISSMGGFQGSLKFKGLSAYSSSKAALVGVTECLAEEFKDKNIAVNCLCLGSVQTEMFSAAFPSYKAARTTKEISSFIAQFATEGQNLFNGKIIPVSDSTP